jgi:hypothetical protein
MVGCAGGCGKKIAAADVESSGWSFLHITGRHRCGTCERELGIAASTAGAPPRQQADVLPPHSIGALKKLPEAPPLHEKVKP